MKVRVSVDSNLTIRNVFEPPLVIVLEEGDATLRGVLEKLASMYPYLRFTERSEMGDDLRHLYLNRESHFTFPEGLDRRVFEGDTIRVEVYMDPLAGG